MERKYGHLTLSSGEQEETLTVTACDRGAEKVTIPMRVDGLPVVGIGDRAFADCSKLKEIVFPEADDALFFEGKTFREIGGNAFMNYTALTSVTLPESVAVIGWAAFYGCTALKEVCFSPLTYVSGYAFSHCTALERVTPLSEVIEGTFSHCASLRQLPVTDRLTEIEDDAFEHCDGLTEICFPQTLRRIGDLAFRGCRGLKRVTFAETEGWFGTCRYDDSHEALDLTDPERNARLLAHVDFDDGPNGLYRK